MNSLFFWQILPCSALTVLTVFQNQRIPRLSLSFPNCNFVPSLNENSMWHLGKATEQSGLSPCNEQHVSLNDSPLHSASVLSMYWYADTWKALSGLFQFILEVLRISSSCGSSASKDLLEWFYCSALWTYRKLDFYKKCG